LKRVAQGSAHDVACCAGEHIGENLSGPLNGRVPQSTPVHLAPKVLRIRRGPVADKAAAPPAGAVCDNLPSNAFAKREQAFIARTGDFLTGDFSEVKIIRKFGSVPDDLSDL
jgi:hypothetical protein